MGNNKNKLSRREFLTAAGIGAATCVASAAAISPLLKLTNKFSLEEFLQKNYRELTPEDKKRIFKRLEREISKKYGVKAKISDPPPLKGVKYAMVINVGRCIGCRKCVYACMKENNNSRSPQIQYIRVMRMEKGKIDLETAVHDYPESEAGQTDKYWYMPVQCHQCEDPPCVKVCPVSATWKEPDGIVVVDYNWCIGCRYCLAACPYYGRRFNWAEPQIPKNELNPDMAYLSNRPRYKGNAEKCTFCLQRTRNGRYTACVEACPTGARKFGNLLDAESEVRKIIDKERVFILKEELNTIPKMYYVFSKA